MRIVFAGTPEFAVPALRALVESGNRPVAVYTQPDRPAGRGRQPKASAVKEEAERLGLPVFQPASLRSAGARDHLAALEPDLMVVAAYGLLLPQTILDIPRLGCVNVHASLLPRWRGAAPIQYALLAGDRVTGVTLMRMEAGLDTGPILLQKELLIEIGETAGHLHDRLAELGAELLTEALPSLAIGALSSRVQDEARATYANKIEKPQARLNFSRPASELARRVAAFNPWPVATAEYRGQVLRILEADAVPAPGPGAPGQLFVTGPDTLDVRCGEGALRLRRLQLPGRDPISARDFINAYPVDGRLT